MATSSRQAPPQRLLEDLVVDKPYHYRYLSIAHLLVFDVNKFNLERLFQDLDRNRDGILDASDFSDPDTNRNELLVNVYQRIRAEFDFDADGSVTFKEFFEGFILEAWLSVPPESGRTIDMSIGDEFHYWAVRFNKELEHRMTVFNGACRVNPSRAAKRTTVMFQQQVYTDNDAMDIDRNFSYQKRPRGANNYNKFNNFHRDNRPRTPNAANGPINNNANNNGFNNNFNVRRRNNNFNNNFNNMNNNLNNNFNNMNNGNRGRRNAGKANPFGRR